MTDTWLTPADHLKAGTLAGEIRCVLCDEGVWDGKAPLSAAPACRPCRELVRRALEILPGLLLPCERRDAA